MSQIIINELCLKIFINLKNKNLNHNVNNYLTFNLGCLLKSTQPPHNIVGVNFQVFECMYKVIKLTAFITKNSLFVRVK